MHVLHTPVRALRRVNKPLQKPHIALLPLLPAHQTSYLLPEGLLGRHGRRGIWFGFFGLLRLFGLGWRRGQCPGRLTGRAGCSNCRCGTCCRSWGWCSRSRRFRGRRGGNRRTGYGRCTGGCARRHHRWPRGTNRWPRRHGRRFVIQGFGLGFRWWRWRWWWRCIQAHPPYRQGTDIGLGQMHLPFEKV